MSDTDLLFMPAVKAAALIRAKKLSPVDYVDSVLKAIERAQPRLNCFRVVMAEEARRDAKAAEQAVVRGDRLGPLHGVPVSIKDLVDVKGVHTRHGSAIFEDNVRPGRRRAGAAPARGGRHRRRQVDDAGIRREGPDRRALLRRHAQSVEPRAHAGRLERRRRGRGRRRPGPAGARHRRRGLGARPGLVLGPGRAEADPGRGAGRHFARRLRQQRLCGPARPHHHRRRDHAFRPGRSQRQGPVDARRRRPAAALAQAFGRGSFGRAHRLYRAHRQSADRRRRARQHALVARRLAGDGRRGRGDHREDRLDRI